MTKTGQTIARFGISTALLTPFHENGALNLGLLCAHAQAVLEGGAHGVTLFGTTGEGASVGFAERDAALRAMIDSGVSGDVMTLGICANAISDAVAQVDQAVARGITRFLLVPPFYFKGLEDAGLYHWHAKLFQSVDPSAQFVLYHIPQITQVPLSVEVVLRLYRDFPQQVIGIKDSAGQWDNTKRLLDSAAVPVLVGDERLLHKAAAMGAAGSICGMANFYPQRMRALFETHVEDIELSRDVDLIVSCPVIPALKHVMMTRTGEAGWAHLRAPLHPLSDAARKALAVRFAARSEG